MTSKTHRLLRRRFFRPFFFFWGVCVCVWGGVRESGFDGMKRICRISIQICTFPGRGEASRDDSGRSEGLAVLKTVTSRRQGRVRRASVSNLYRRGSLIHSPLLPQKETPPPPTTPSECCSRSLGILERRGLPGIQTSTRSCCNKHDY